MDTKTIDKIIENIDQMQDYVYDVDEQFIRDSKKYWVELKQTYFKDRASEEKYPQYLRTYAHCVQEKLSDLNRSGQLDSVLKGKIKYIKKFYDRITPGIIEIFPLKMTYSLQLPGVDEITIKNGFP